MRIQWTHPLACMLALAVASSALAAEPDAASPELRHASVEIDTSEVGEEGPVIKRRIRERTDVVLRAAGVLPARPDEGDPVIFVEVDELTGTEPGYQCEVWISHLGKVVGERRRVECTLCTESEIVQRVETTVGELVPLLPSEGDVEPTDSSPTVTPPTETETETDGSTTTTTTPTDDARRKGLGGLGKAGVALIAVGVAGAAAGAVMVALPPKVDPDDPLFETTYRPPGIATLAAGGAALVTGVVLLVVDRRRARPRTTALVPILTPTTAALTWSARF
jgi:hypothetical protein